MQKKGTEVSRVRTRFQGLPDAPVTKFKLNFFGGKRGLIENSRNLYKAKRRAKVSFSAHNGRVQTTNPVIAIRCGK